MAQQAMPAWVNKLASAASAAEKEAFVVLGKDVANLPVMKAALERDSGWALVKGDLVSWNVMMSSVLTHMFSSGKHCSTLGHPRQCGAAGRAPS